jgi:hypothetical protein
MSEATVASIEAKIGTIDLAVLNAGTHIPVTADTSLSKHVGAL